MQDNDALFQTVVRLLSQCSTRERAKTLQQIGDEAARFLEMPGAADGRRRMVERVIEDNLELFPWPVVSGDEGLWIPEDHQELNRYLDSLKKRCLKMFKRRKIVRRKAILAGFTYKPGGFTGFAHKDGELF
jgi:hypothetical protein